jgi:hypothetical protein
MDIGSGAIKIAIVKNNKLHSTHAVEVGNRDLKFVLHDIKQFLRKNRVSAKNVNVLVKDYKTRYVKMERISKGELKNALLYEREEKIGTTEILGDNYRDNHVIQKKTNNSLEILLSVVNEQEINKQEAFLETVNLPSGNFIMECFLYNDIAQDNSVIIDIGFSSIEIMFFDRKKVMKTSLLKKGLGDIITDLKEKVDPSMSYKDLQQFSFENQTADGYDIIISWLNLYAENVINTINTFLRENSKSLAGLNIYYTGGIFINSRMADYFNYQMGVEASILKVHGQNQDPLFNNSIALAFKAGTMGVVGGGYNSVLKYTNIAASYILVAVLSAFVFMGGYAAYQYFYLNRQAQLLEGEYEQVKSDFAPLYADYTQLNSMLYGVGQQQQAIGKASNLGKVLTDIKEVLNTGITLDQVLIDGNRVIAIEGRTTSYTSLGVFSEQLKNKFGSVSVKELYVDKKKGTCFRLECTI